VQTKTVASCRLKRNEGQPLPIGPFGNEAELPRKITRIIRAPRFRSAKNCAKFNVDLTLSTAGDKAEEVSSRERKRRIS
jgi:hypothetical protein